MQDTTDDTADDDRDDAPPAKRRADRTLLYVLLGLGLLGLLGCGGLAAVGWLLLRIAPAPVAAPAPVGGREEAAPAGPRAVVTRDQFRAAVIGKTEAEVLAAVGKPDETSDDGAMKLWRYKRRTRDPITGEIDIAAKVVVERGKVTSVFY